MIDVVDVVDVESILEPELERIDSLIDGDTQVILIRGPVSSTFLQESRAQLETEGFVIGAFDLITYRTNLFVNPNGFIRMEDLWRVIIPSVIADATYVNIRLQEASGTYYDSLLDFMIFLGLGMAFQ